MSAGLFALLDDVASIAKMAAASVDDVVGQAARTSMKSAGVVIDDAAVTPKYVVGLAAERELPIIARIARGSLRNKLLFLLPIALILSVVAPWSITPLLMLGGGYLCFEGAEKVFGKFFHPHHQSEKDTATKEKELVQECPKEVEDAKVAGAIRTDFILSAEIMAISLASITEGGFWMRAAVLALVAVAITVAVYGAVALIVKADDVGVRLTEQENGLARKVGYALVKSMPGFLKALTVFGTAAMLWVGGGIILHGLEDLGWGGPAHFVHHWAEEVAHGLSAMRGFVEWLVSALGGLVVGLLVGLALIPLVTKVVMPLSETLRAGSRGQESA